MDVRLQGHFTTKSPLSHISESLSTTSYLAQEPILQPDGAVCEVFCLSGNSWRGQLRDRAAAYMLARIGDPRLPLDAFHLLFSGGRIGGEQTVNVERARAWRRTIPLVALFGGGVGNQILPGKLRIANAYPVCREAIPALLHTDPDAIVASYRGMTMEKSFSRTDDGKDERLNQWLSDGAPTQAALMDGSGEPAVKPKRGKAAGEVADQMRMTAELLIAGVRLETRITALDVSEIELGALVSALHQFARSPHVGGQASRGHGLVDLDYEIVDLDTGEVRPFVAIRGGALTLADPARTALDAYDAHLKIMYDAMLSERGGEIVKMLGAAA
ncbi:MAG: hypothetical protein IT337_01540 [Thermomicrobiales bacterium]|nr:hypothetical protein [Thermomicrobiales bacterium]